MIDAALNQADGFGRIFRNSVFAQHFNSEADAAERVLDLVRQLRGRRAYRGECFGATQGTFHFVGFGDVNQRQNLSVLTFDFQRRRINIKRARGPVRVEVPTPSISGRLDVRSSCGFQKLGSLW